MPLFDQAALTQMLANINVAPDLSDQKTERVREVVTSTNFADRRGVFGQKLGRKLHEAMTAATGAGAARTAEEANGTILVLKQYKIAEMAAPGVVVPLGAKTALLSTLLKSLPDVPRNFAELEQVLDAIRNVTV